MRLADELLALLHRYAARAPLPRVRALHLPRRDRIDGKHGEFCALELDDGSLGLSYALLGDTLARLAATQGSAVAAGDDPLVVVARGLAHEADAVARTLAFATVNALTCSLFTRAGYVPPASADALGGLDPAPGEHIGMVGLFRPLLARITAAGARLTVLELKAELAGEHAGYRVTLDPGALASCDKVLATSSILLNDTADRVLAACAGARRVALVGPGAGCVPDPLFARGVTLVGGSWITDRRGFVDAFAAAAPWSAHARKFAIEPATYPGFAGLLAALR